MKTVLARTYWVNIFISGPLAVIEQVCRSYCLSIGLCVTVEPTKFIYAGGEEVGTKVGLINYPRFDSTPEKINSKAHDLALLLLDVTCQYSVLLMNPTNTSWITKREEV